MDPRTKLRGITLLKANDPGYIAYVEERQLNTMHIRMAPMVMCATDRLSRCLEPAIRVWLENVGSQPERILSYEVLGRDNRYYRHYREMDFVVWIDGIITLGELKVSYSSKSRNKAHRQLRQNYELMRRAGLEVRLLLIHINLLEPSASPYIQDFNADFLRMGCYHRRIHGGLAYYFLEMGARDVFQWAVDRGLIPRGSEGVLEEALGEAADRNEKRLRRNALRQSGVSYDEWPADLRREPEDPEGGWTAFGGEDGESVMQYGLRKAYRLAQERKGKP
jgi:hypothetical protein